MDTSHQYNVRCKQTSSNHMVINPTAAAIAMSNKQVYCLSSSATIPNECLALKSTKGQPIKPWQLQAALCHVTKSRNKKAFQFISIYVDRALFKGPFSASFDSFEWLFENSHLISIRRAWPHPPWHIPQLILIDIPQFIHEYFCLTANFSLQ